MEKGKLQLVDPKPTTIIIPSLPTAAQDAGNRVY